MLYLAQREAETSLESLLASGNRLIDVRTETEFKGNTATSAANIPLATLLTQLDTLDKSVKTCLVNSLAGHTLYFMRQGTHM